MTDLHRPRWRPTPLIKASFALHALALTVMLVAPVYWSWILGALLLNHALLTLFGLWPRSQALGPNWIRLPAASTARNEIALTIDDGPDPDVTPQVLDLLERYAVRATFFCVGEKAARYPDICRGIVRRGHAIENHSQHHRWHFSFLGYAGFKREVQTAQDTLTAITGQPPQFFRAPAGLRNPLLDPVLARLGLRLASWSTRAFDTHNNDAEVIKKKLLSGVQPGAILLLHDGNAARTTDGIPVILKTLPALLDAAKAAQLRWVTLRQAAL